MLVIANRANLDQQFRIKYLRRYCLIGQTANQSLATQSIEDDGPDQRIHSGWWGSKRDRPEPAIREREADPDIQFLSRRRITRSASAFQHNQPSQGRRFPIKNDQTSVGRNA